MFEQVDVSGDQKIDYEEFVAMLKLMDRRLKSLPATAQVASQQVCPYNFNLYSLFRYISLIINPRCMREGYGSLFVCVCVCLSVCLLPC